MQVPASASVWQDGPGLCTWGGTRAGSCSHILGTRQLQLLPGPGHRPLAHCPDRVPRLRPLVSHACAALRPWGLLGSPPRRAVSGDFSPGLWVLWRPAERREGGGFGEKDTHAHAAATCNFTSWKRLFGPHSCARGRFSKHNTVCVWGGVMILASRSRTQGNIRFKKCLILDPRVPGSSPASGSPHGACFSPCLRPCLSLCLSDE